jgi:hypothetical protein
MLTLESIRRSNDIESRMQALEFESLFRQVHGMPCPDFDDFDGMSDFHRRLFGLREALDMFPRRAATAFQ